MKNNSPTLTSTSGSLRASHWTRAMLAGSCSLYCLAALPASAQIAAWDFFGENTGVATSAADVFDINLDSSNLVTRGAGAASSNASNSFRTAGFQNNGISTANTDYFQITLSPNSGQTLSLSTIDAKFAGTASFAVSPGVSSQFAYSLDGTNFTLIESPQLTVGSPATLAQISLTGIPALQNLTDATTVTIRYYASGQTGTGGWGFNSPSAAAYGLAIGGTLAPSGGPPDTTAPSISTFDPADNEIDVNENDNLVITFDETIQKGTGNIVIKKTSDNSTVETIDVASGIVTTSGANVTINPTNPLDFATDYYVLIDAGAIRDNATVPNNFAGISLATTWNFITRNAPAPNTLFITQYYEGSGVNKFIEIYNNGATTVDLSQYSLTLWTNANTEAWKSAGSPSSSLPLSGTLDPGSYYLFYNTGAAAPTYAVPGDVANTSVINFNGDDSVVLFRNTDIVDAVSFTDAGNEGADKSFYRLNFDVGFNTTAGSTVLDFPLVWGVKTNAEVDAAINTEAWYLERKTVPSTLSLSISVPSAIEENNLTAAVGTVTRTGSTVGDLIVSISFDDPTEVNAPFDVTILDGFASANFDIATLEDALPDGDVIVNFTASATGFISGNTTFTVLDDGDVLPPAPLGLKINEIRVDDDETDGFEYFEIYNTTNAPLSLNNVAYVVVGDAAPGNYGAVESITVLPDVTIPANGFYLVANAASVPVDRDTDADQTVDFTATPNVGTAGLNFENGDNVTHILAYGYIGNTSSDIDSNDDGTMNASLPWVTTLDAISLIRTVEVPGTTPAANNEYYYGSALGGADVGPDATFSPAHVYRSVDGAGTWTIGPFGADLSVFSLADNSVLVDVKDTPGLTNVVAVSGYATWAGANGASNNPLEDHDGDTVPNGVEYFFGATGSTFTTMPTVVNGAITWPKDASANATYVVKSATDLQDWQPVVGGVVDNGTSVTYTLPEGLPKIFVILEVTIP